MLHRRSLRLVTGLYPTAPRSSIPRAAFGTKANVMAEQNRKIMQPEKVIDLDNLPSNLFLKKDPLLFERDERPFEYYHDTREVKTIKLTCFNEPEKELDEIELDSPFFATEVRKDIIHACMRWEQANEKPFQGHTKTRGEVRGTTKKPFQQKGTGRARQGSLRGPHQYKGGVAHGPRKERIWTFKLNQKFRMFGLRAAIVAKYQEGNLIVVDNFDLPDLKTKLLTGLLKAHGWTDKRTMACDDNELNAFTKLASTNVFKFNYLREGECKVYDMLRHEQLVLSLDALRTLETRLSPNRFKINRQLMDQEDDSSS